MSDERTNDDDTRVRDSHAAAIVDRLADFDRVVEVGIGRRTDVAAGLADRGVSVTATDLELRAVPSGVRFVRDDVTDPDPAVYEDVDAIYALNCPPELQRSAAALARRREAAFLFTTLGTDPAVVPARPEAIPGGTLFWASVSRDN